MYRIAFSKLKSMKAELPGGSVARTKVGFLTVVAGGENSGIAMMGYRNIISEKNHLENFLQLLDKAKTEAEKLRKFL